MRCSSVQGQLAIVLFVLMCLIAPQFFFQFAQKPLQQPALVFLRTEPCAAPKRDTSSTSLKKSVEMNHKRKLVVCSTASIFHYFRDFVNPLVVAVGVHFEVQFDECDARLKWRNLTHSDVVFHVQRPFDLNAGEARHWLINTEPLDSEPNVVTILPSDWRVIDYCLGNIARVKATSFWLPIVESPYPVFRRPRKGTKKVVCSIMGATTPYRERFFLVFNDLLKNYSSTVHHQPILGWDFIRDLKLQNCDVLFHVAKSEKAAFALARLRVDLAYLYDVPVISQAPHQHDMDEYEGTMVFSDFESLPRKIIQKAIEAKYEVNVKKRNEVLQKRRKRFWNVVSKIVGSS